MSTLTPPPVTPMMAQWKKCKEEAKDALLLFRLGDFYEAFEEDAEKLATAVGLTLTKRGDTPMSGIPFHSSEGYIDKLVAKGFKVAIAEQVEDPKETKGIVKREIVRILTNATLINSTLIDEKKSRYLACITKLNQSFGVAKLDITTGEYTTTEVSSLQEVAELLTKIAPKELLLSEKSFSSFEKTLEEINSPLTVRPDWLFEHKYALEEIQKTLNVASLDGFGLSGKTAAINAAGALLAYIKHELKAPVEQISTLKNGEESAFMRIDRATSRHLELIESVNPESSLLYHIDKTKTPMGARLLHSWLQNPLLSVSKIEERQTAIKTLLENKSLLEALSESLAHVRDLSRLVSRLLALFAYPRDLLSLALSLEAVPKIKLLLETLGKSVLFEKKDRLFDLSELTNEIKSALVDVPPRTLSEGSVIRLGYNKELDSLLLLKENGEGWLKNYEQTLKAEIKAKTLKVTYNRAFGYAIEVSRLESVKMPEHFHKKQTLTNSERFTSPELKEYESKILRADYEIAKLEAELFGALVEKTREQKEKINTIAEAISEIDALFSLSLLAAKRGFVCPVVDESDIFEIKSGRHLVLDSADFIANDTCFSKQAGRLHLITGPNMAGKSTFLRQTALIAILAQIGSFVPAKSAHIGLIDQVFSRIGASDDLFRGKSTFMVEMTETANILNSASDKSLVLLDEIGRGTSTYDGIAIAWAVAEYLLKTEGKKAKTLFATHYSELNALEKEIDGAINYHVSVYEGEDEIVFLRKIARGGTDKSYGVHVAKLAGLPKEAIAIAKARLAKMEGKKEKRPVGIQLSLFPSEA